MSKGKVGLLIVASVLCFFFVGSCASALSWRTDAVNLENSLEAQYKDNQNTYDNMWKRIKEMAQVPAMYASDLKKLYDSAIAARYGKDGSKAMFQWLKEHNPKLDPGVYKQLQRAIEAGRKEFAAGQTALLDRKRAYKNHLRSNTGIIWSGLMGYPTIDMNKYDIVTSQKTETVFKNKKDNHEMKLR